MPNDQDKNDNGGTSLTMTEGTKISMGLGKKQNPTLTSGGFHLKGFFLGNSGLGVFKLGEKVGIPVSSLNKGGFVYVY